MRCAQPLADAAESSFHESRVLWAECCCRSVRIGEQQRRRDGRSANMEKLDRHWATLVSGGVLRLD